MYGNGKITTYTKKDWKHNTCTTNKFIFFFSIFKKLNDWSWRTTTAVGKKMAKKAGHGTVYNWTNEPQANLPQIPLKPGVFLASKPHN